MRTQKQLVFYQSILEVLLDPGCPFCRFLKAYQASRLQHHSDQDIHLCSFHTWGLAAVQNALTVPEVFIHLVDEPAAISTEVAGCDMCREISAEEDRRIREFIRCIYRAGVSDWLRTPAAVLCIPHGIKPRRQVRPVIAARIDAIIESCRRQLTEELQTLREKPESDRPRWGSLGRAAEFFVSQRGLHS